LPQLLQLPQLWQLPQLFGKSVKGTKIKIAANEARNMYPPGTLGTYRISAERQRD
jgi:hypothetical protein